MLDQSADVAGDLFREAFDQLLPPSRDTVDEYTAQHRLVPRRSGIGYELWSHETAPFLVAPMRSSTSLSYLTTCVAGPGGCGKTAIAENVLLHAVKKQPRNCLLYMQNEAALEAQVKTKFNPLIRVHEEMYSRLGNEPTDDTLHFKNFLLMWVEFLAANYGNLISKRAPLIILDEIDAFDPSLGDVKVLADVRRARFGALSMLIAMSHADLATGNDPVKHWKAGIMKIYADSTRRTWQWPCPECGRWSSPAPFAKRAMLLSWPLDEKLEVIEREAHLLCPVNNCRIPDSEIAGMNLAAYRHPDLYFGYLAEGQTITEDGEVTGTPVRSDTDGFFITGTMSPFNLKGIGGLAREMAKAEREFEVSGDETTLKEVTVKQLGYLFTSKGPVGSIDAETLAERAKGEIYWPSADAPRVVPEGVRFATAWFDIQALYFDVLVRGFGVDTESWVIDNFRVPVETDTSTDRDAWYRLLCELARRRYHLQNDPSRGMAIRAVGYDSQGARGVTDRAYEAWTRVRRDGLARNYGVLDGRDVWSIIPTQGASLRNAPRLQTVYPDNQRKDKGQSKRGVVPVARFNPDQFKDSLAGQLHRAMPGPGYAHLPAALLSKEPPHVLLEQMTSEKRDQNGHWAKPHNAVRNEMLDKMVGTHVLAHLHGLARINWEAPPIWAQTWGLNTMVGPMIAAGQDASASPSVAPIKRRTIGDALKGRNP